MKTIITTLLILLAVMEISSKPVISYIIPDIVAPNMPTYIEIIGPFDSDNLYLNALNFWSDGIYMNNNDHTIKVKCANPEDEWKLTFGICYVSWNGMMLFTQVFPNPKLTPNSSDWEELTSEFRIPIQVINNSTKISNTDTIYIVKPWNLGDVSNNPERVLGEGSLGKRSRRGAMIVDSLILSSSTYTVSTKDCDTNTTGNQAYLPFVLLSPSKIIGSANTIIDVSGETAKAGHGGNAGPGGGGGGGRFCDVIFGSGGDNGGNGFVSGGRGGWNSATGGGGLNKYGQSSGDSAKSLNGVYPPLNPSNYHEASGGGTGHPFGKSGIGTGDAFTDNPKGGYGGGSGFTQRQNGGSGGYATKGANSDGRNNQNEKSESGGSVHGNIVGVPLAGGSGGGSGNPHSTGDCSGSGGGGGGAMLLYAPYIQNVSIIANGANGTNGTGPDGKATRGGSGSGGFAGIGTKLNLNSLNLQVEGGKNADDIVSGGAGRMRFDAPSWTIDNTSIPLDASKFRGPTTDTSHYISRKHKITGSCDKESKIVCVIKPESQNWGFINQGGIVYNDGYWEMSLDLSIEPYDKDSLFYFFVMQETKSQIKDITQHFYEPEFIMSQASSNIFMISNVDSKVEDSWNPSTISFDCKPNPFTNEMEIIFKTNNSVFVNISIFDALCKKIALLANDYFDSGNHSIKLNAVEHNLSDGIYYCTITIGELRETKRITLIK